MAELSELGHSRDSLDFGSGFTGRWYAWKPERDIQTPEWHAKNDDIPDAEHAGIILTCVHGLEGAVPFSGRTPDQREGWTVESEDPLTLSPSIVRTECGCHGFIREGRWVSA